MADAFEYGLLKRFAVENRRYSTETESILWERLNNRQMGFKFRRQHIIGTYIADFACLKCRLIIEIDGKYHDYGTQPVKDLERTAYLEQQGFKVIRFTNDEIIGNIDAVIENIKQYLTIQI